MAKEKICGVYQIISKTRPDRFYIGSARVLSDRWRQHRYQLSSNKHHSPKLQHHYNKYGKDDLIYQILEQFNFVSKKHLQDREQYYLDTLKPWFNVSKTAGSTLGYRHTQRVKDIIGEHSRNQVHLPHTEETKRKMSEHSATKGKPAWNKGISPKPESIEKRRQKMLGYKTTQETKDKISKKLLGVPKSQESIEKRTKTREGWVFPEESKSLVSESLKKFFMDHPEAGAHLSEIQIGRKQSQETIDKRVAKLKGKKQNVSQEERNRRAEQMKINRLNRWVDKKSS